ncbi:MAG: hypothetical protein R3Y12_01935 [Clostridia bacterium]
MKDVNSCNNSQRQYMALADHALDRVKSFNIFDFTMIKLCLVSIGLVIGSMYNKFIRKNAVFFIFAAVLSYLYLTYKLFFEKE